MVKVVPFPSWLAWAMVARCFSRIVRDTDNPSPAPWDLVVKKGSKMRALAAGAMPVPVSEMRTTTCPVRF